jgi:hypothetical protein
VVAGFAGSTADAFTLLERLEKKLEAAPGQVQRACVELAKDWRTDKYLRNLEAMLIVTDGAEIYVITGAGDVLEPEHDVAAIGSGGNFALAAARGLMESDLSPRRRPQGHGHRRRHLRLHQRQPDGGEHPQMTDLTPREIVSELDRFIIGQADAKRAVAVALRNRWRRKQLGRHARRGLSEEHPDDRPDRRRQDRDQPPAGEAGPRAVPEGRGDEVHRGRLCRPRRGADHPRSGDAAIADDPRAHARGGEGPGQAAAEERVIDALAGRRARGRRARCSAASCGRANWTTPMIEVEVADAAPALPMMEIPACRRDGGADEPGRHASARPSAGAPPASG